MNNSELAVNRRKLYEVASELCDLFQNQIDILRRGLTATGMEQYLNKKRQIQDLQAELKSLSATVSPLARFSEYPGRSRPGVAQRR